MEIKWRIIAISLIVATNLAQAQCPSSGNTLLETQADVDEFIAKYPNCTELKNDLILGSFDHSSDINDLSGLSGLVAIGGKLDIFRLNSLSGLNNIKVIGKDLRLFSNGRLNDLINFVNLDSIKGGLYMTDNTQIQDLSSFENLKYLGSYILMWKNTSLRAINGFQNIKKLYGKVSIVNSPLLENLNGFQNIKSISGGLELIDIAIKDFTDFASLGSVDSLNELSEGHLTISQIPNLESLKGLEKIKKIDGGLYIGSCPALESMEELSSLEFLGGYFDIYNTGIRNLKGLQNVMIGGAITIVNNDQLDNISDLNTHSTINGSIRIAANDHIRKIDALAHIDSVKSSLYIKDNRSLSRCYGICELLSNGYIGGGISLGSNLEGCNSKQEVIDKGCIPTSTISKRQECQYSILTNPVTDDLILTLNKKCINNLQFKISNTQGVIMQTAEVKKNKNQSIYKMDVNALPNGMYFLIEAHNLVLSSSFIKI